MRSSSAFATKQETPTLEEQALFQNLCILGVVGRKEDVEVTRTCFRRSNNKALEYVLYRLYSIIEGTTQKFNHIFPVGDRMQQTAFYQIIGEWTGNLKKDGRLEPSLVLPASALKANNNSTRLVAFLLELSSLALRYDLDNTSPDTRQAAYLPSIGNGSSSGGLLDDTLLPADVRLGISISRAKQKASEFLLAAATGSAACAALEQSSIDFNRTFYELQVPMRRQDTETVQFTDADAAAGGTGSPQRSDLGSPTSCGAVARGGLGIKFGPPAAAGAVNGPAGSPSSFSALSSSVSGLQRQRHAGQLDAVSLRKLESFQGRLDEHLQVHVELGKVLHPVVSGSSAGRVDCIGQAVGNLQTQQILHPYQIDGQALSVLTAAGGVEDNGRQGMNDQLRRRSAKEAPFRPDSIIESVKSFSSLLNAVAPHVTQMAMAGENAGLPPLVQLPNQPSSHAAHVLHQLQVLENADRQIVHMNRKLQEQAGQYGAFLRTLRQECNRVTNTPCLRSGHIPLDEDFFELEAHLVLPSVITNPGCTPNNPPSIDLSVPDSGNLAAVFDVLRLMNGTTPHSHMAALTVPSTHDPLSTGKATPKFGSSYLTAHSTTGPPYAGTSEGCKFAGPAGFSSRPTASDNMDPTRWPSSNSHIALQDGAATVAGTSAAAQRPAGQPSTGITSSTGSGFSTARGSASIDTSLPPGDAFASSRLPDESTLVDVPQSHGKDQEVQPTRGAITTDLTSAGWAANVGRSHVGPPSSSPDRSYHGGFGSAPVLQTSVAWAPSMDAVAGLHEDTDFSLLAAEGEHVSQVLLAGASIWGNNGGAGQDNIDTDLNCRPAPTGGSNPYWNDPVRGPGGVGTQQGLSGPLDCDNSDDVLMVDTNKEPASGPSSKGLLGSNRTTEVGNGALMGMNHGQQSPCRISTGLVSHVDSMQISPAPQHVMSYIPGRLGADILALRARMQAVSQQQRAN